MDLVIKDIQEIAINVDLQDLEIEISEIEEDHHLTIKDEEIEVNKETDIREGKDIVIREIILDHPANNEENLTTEMIEDQEVEADLDPKEIDLTEEILGQEVKGEIKAGKI